MHIVPQHCDVLTCIHMRRRSGRSLFSKATTVRTVHCTNWSNAEFQIAFILIKLTTTIILIGVSVVNFKNVRRIFSETNGLYCKTLVFNMCMSINVSFYKTMTWCLHFYWKLTMAFTRDNRVFRLPDVVVSGLTFYCNSFILFFLFFFFFLFFLLFLLFLFLFLFFFFFFFSSATLRAHWTKLNQNRPHVRNWVRFENACPKFGVSPSLKNWA